MALLYQHEKNILVKMAKYHEGRAKHCQKMAEKSGRNIKVYLRQADTELEKAIILRKTAS